MLQRIPIDRLRPGMFVHELCGSWMDHPFWRSRFVLRSEADLSRIVGSGIREVWIDASKGAGVADAPGEAEVHDAVERELRFVATQPAPLEPERPAPAGDDAAGSGTALQEAAALYRRSRPHVMAMFNEARLGKAIDVDRCEGLVEDISRSVLDNPGALINIARLKRRDEYTYMHSVAVCALMVALARRLGQPEPVVREAGLAGMLHDIGKAAMPLEVLNKPGQLTDAEFDLMRSHPARGHALLLEGGAGAAALDVCLHHHEKVDGSGYPKGLAGKDLSLLARMAAVCDVYDAITSERPYKRAWDPGDAVRKMAQWKGHFDAAVFQAFVKTVGIYPVGSLVRLDSQRLAVVVEVRPAALLAPRVKAFYDLAARRRIAPESIDLAEAPGGERIAGWEPAERWPFDDLDRLWGAPASLHG